MIKLAPRLERRNMDRLSVTLIALGAGVGVLTVGTVSALYLHHRMTRRIQKELSHLTATVVELRKEIVDLKTLSKRKSVHGSTISDETDVYYDFSDEGEDNDIFDGLNKYLGQEENLRSIDMVLDLLDSQPELSNSVYNRIAALKEKFFNNVDYLWRFAKACHVCAVIAGQQGNAEKKKELCYEAMQQASAALALTDDDANVHKWYAIAIGSCTDYESMQNKIKFGFIFKEHIQIALRLKPDDESLYHLMGRWCYEVAVLSWLEKKVASTWYGELPTASLLEAREYFLEVEKLRDSQNVWKENRLYIGKSYIAEGDYKAAIQWLDSASEGPTVERMDFLIIDELESLRNKYCGFRQ